MCALRALHYITGRGSRLMWRFVQDRSHGRNGGIRSFAAFPPNILNLNGKSGFRKLQQLMGYTDSFLLRGGRSQNWRFDPTKLNHLAACITVGKFVMPGFLPYSRPFESKRLEGAFFWTCNGGSTAGALQSRQTDAAPEIREACVGSQDIQPGIGVQINGEDVGAGVVRTIEPGKGLILLPQSGIDHRDVVGCDISVGRHLLKMI